MPQRPVDDEIQLTSRRWEFNKEVAQHFDSHVRKSLPLYDEIQSMIVSLSDAFITQSCSVYDLGTATGETIALLQTRHRSIGNARYVGIDSTIPSC